MNKGQFKTGGTPWNKGKPYPSTGRTKDTQFKTGEVRGKAAQLLQPIGAERITKDGYLQVKVRNDVHSSKRWKAVHLILWEQHNGKVPDGHIVVFRDGDKSNITIENLECISRSENLRRNSIHRLPKELVAVIRMRGELNHQIKRRSSK